MKPRSKRLIVIACGLAALGVATALVLNAFNSNLVFFFSPTQVAANEAPQGRVGIVTRGAQVFAPRMIAEGAPGLIINTGSKQGITTPPGDPAYNISKAGVKVFTEALQHHLRNLPDCRIKAHLFIPGFVFTPLTAQGRTEKPAGAWTPEQTVDFLFASIEQVDFYILCPDNDVDRRTDEKRIRWAAGDIADNRPPLSRWHPEHAEPFKAWLLE